MLIAVLLVCWGVAGLAVWVWDVAETRKNRAVLVALLDFSKEQRETRLAELNSGKLVTAGSELL